MKFVSTKKCCQNIHIYIYIERERERESVQYSSQIFKLAGAYSESFLRILIVKGFAGQNNPKNMQVQNT